MPYFIKKKYPVVTVVALIFLIFVKSLSAETVEGITTYYIRFDLKSSRNRISDSRLTMIPAQKDFRAANFSYVPVSGFIQALPQDNTHTLENRAKKNAFIQLLEKKGLKSINTRDSDTIISYEGCVQIPVALHIFPYNDEQHGYPYNARVLFSPISFPDQWEPLYRKFKYNEILDNFFLFFK